MLMRSVGATACLPAGLMFTRLSRGQTRAQSILFTDKAVIRCASCSAIASVSISIVVSHRRIRGHLYFMMQIVEGRKHQLLEAHVRLYVVRACLSCVTNLLPGSQAHGPCHRHCPLPSAALFILRVSTCLSVLHCADTFRAAAASR